MGTSASTKGGSNKNPLIPAWADDAPGTPQPELDGTEKRFNAFRRNFGSYASGSGGPQKLEKALGKFASTTTGGSNIGPRRLGQVYRSGGLLGEILKEFATGDTSRAFNVNSFHGQTASNFAQAVAELIAGESPDSDRIACAAHEAIARVFEFDEDFDPNTLSASNIAQILIEFLTQSIFQLVLEEAGPAWDHAPTKAVSISCENELLDLTRAIVDNSMSESLHRQAFQLDGQIIQTEMRKAAKLVWQTWERYDV